MGNLCCESKKRKTIYDASDELNNVNDLKIEGGILGDSQKLFDDDEIFEEYIDENLGDPEENKDPSGLLTFDYFLRVYKTALIWNRIKFQERKTELIKHRREALKQNNMETFRAVHLSINTADETCLQDVLEEILLRINLPDKKFQESLNFHFDDEEKKTQIRLAMSEAAIDNGEGLAKTETFKPKEISMSKKEAIALQQKVQALSID